MIQRKADDYISNFFRFLHHKSSVYQFDAVDSFDIVICNKFVTNGRNDCPNGIRVVKAERKLYRLFYLSLCKKSQCKFTDWILN